MNLKNVNEVAQSQYNVKWACPKRRKKKNEIHPHFHWAVENFLLSKGCTGDYNIIGYNTYQKIMNKNEHRSQFQANELFYGAPRYEWCLVRFKGNDTASNLFKVLPKY